MMNSIQKVPTRILNAINGENLSSDTVIFYKEDQGWVYKRCDVDLIDQTLARRTNLDDDIRPLESLGPFGTRPTNVSIAILLGTDMYQTKFDQGLSELAQYDDIECVGQHAPLTPVTLQGAARDVAHIPHDATHFCWVYPPAGLTQLGDRVKKKIDKKVAKGDLSYTFLAFGGFVYFRVDGYNYTMLQANALVKADNGLTFHGPFKWRSVYTAHLDKQGRFQNVTVSSLLDSGIKYYCFINPNEKFQSSVDGYPDWTPAKNGAFVYLYESPAKSHPYDRYFTIADAPITDHIGTQVMPFSLVRRSQSLRSSLPLLQNSVTDKQSASSLPSSNADKDRFKCLICFDRTIQCILIPCKHMCACAECAQIIKEKQKSRCPICRQTFTEIWNVFL
ncbi:unnamed protein product [Rotaria sordida]|uniref:RING-type domain-containing protein n=1 Tax=Rotaria sordida TaxID=392033 RepID=A0A818XGH6_9BILA|nr:unnamed protein product [Rotaria sordida]